MEVLGVIAIGVLDVLVPLSLAAWLIVLNARRHRTQFSELRFWFFAFLALVLPVFASVHGILSVSVYEGAPVIPTTMLAFPGSIVPIFATVLLSGVFFDDATWASTGYFAVMPIYLAGVVLWQLTVVVAIRRTAQVARLRRLAQSVVDGSRARSLAVRGRGS